MENFVDHKPLISDKCSSSSDWLQKDHQITQHEAQLHVHCTYYSRRHFLLILIIYYNKDWSSLNQSLTLCTWLICFWYLELIWYLVACHIDKKYLDSQFETCHLEWACHNRLVHYWLILPLFNTSNFCCYS